MKRLTQEEIDTKMQLIVALATDILVDCNIENALQCIEGGESIGELSEYGTTTETAQQTFSNLELYTRIAEEAQERQSTVDFEQLIQYNSMEGKVPPQMVGRALRVPDNATILALPKGTGKTIITETFEEKK